jgi:hypothetical protein
VVGTHAVQGLQIQLVIGLDRHKAHPGADFTSLFETNCYLGK